MPILFVARQIGLAELFKDDLSPVTTFLRVTIISAFDAPLVVILCAALFVPLSTPADLQLPDARDGILFVAGALASGIIANGANQISYHLAGDQKWYPSMLFFLIPLLVLILAPGFYYITGYGWLPPSKIEIFDALCVAVIIVAYYGFTNRGNFIHAIHSIFAGRRQSD